MTGRVIAIGDIHGCSVALDRLLQEIKLTQDDVLVTLGDIVDRGPDSKGVIELLLNASERCQLRPVLGNHEEMMLKVVVHSNAPQSWIQFGGVSTLDSYRFTGDLSVIPPRHIEFLQSFLPYFETPTHFFIHANYDPEVPLHEQSSRVARWLSLNEQLPGPHMSGKIAIVGHTPDRTGEIFSLRHLKCIDTYCYGGQWLTALDISNGRVWQTNEMGELRQ